MKVVRKWASFSNRQKVENTPFEDGYAVLDVLKDMHRGWDSFTDIVPGKGTIEVSFWTPFTGAFRVREWFNTLIFRGTRSARAFEVCKFSRTGLIGSVGNKYYSATFGPKPNHTPREGHWVVSFTIPIEQGAPVFVPEEGE